MRAKSAVITGFSVKRELLERLDKERGDVSRSRYISRLLEAGLKDHESQNQQKEDED
jgi:metal-responsive CopG/Arc/MetJ family transcriptional regulator